MTLDTVNDLLETIDRLPPLDRTRVRGRVNAAMNRPAMEARALLGLIALDLAGPAPGIETIDLTDQTALSA